MRKALLALAAIGAMVGMRQLIKRTAPKMREHCKEMMGAQPTGDEGMAAQEAGRGEPVAAI